MKTIPQYYGTQVRETRKLLLLLLEHDNSPNGHEHEQHRADDWSDDDLHDVERVACWTRPRERDTL